MTDTWTPDRIRAWSEATFPNVTRRAAIRRSLAEWIEMDAAIEARAPEGKIAEEAADVWITVCRWGDPVPAPWDPPVVFGSSGLSGWIAEAICDPDGVGFDWVRHYLTLLVGSSAALQSAVARKMAINVKRKWSIGPDGTGQHIRNQD